MLNPFKPLWLFIILVATITLSGCRTSMPVSQQNGTPDVGFILIVSDKKYANKTVTVDINNGQTIFPAKAVRSKHSNSKGTAYQLPSGKKTITVSHNGDVLYSGQIILNQQETKKITLP